MNTAPRVQVRSAQLFERAVSLRLPFRFGAATVTQAPQAFVRVQVEVDGRSALGASAELMVPKWFDKNPALTHEQNFEQLRQALRCARDAYLGTDGRLTAHGLSPVCLLYTSMVVLVGAWRMDRFEAMGARCV